MVADEHAVIRIGITGILSDLLPGSTIYQAGHLDKVLELMTTHVFPLVILDTTIPGGNSIQMLEVLFRKNKHVKILMLSGGDETLLAWRYIKSGAYGFIRKNAGVDEFEHAVITVMDNKPYLNSAIKNQLVKDMLNDGGRNTNAGFYKLSDRELEVARLLAKGETTLKIAAMLHLNAGTISTYKGRIFSKLGVNSLIGLAEKLSIQEPQVG